MGASRLSLRLVVLTLALTFLLSGTALAAGGGGGSNSPSGGSGSSAGDSQYVDPLAGVSTTSSHSATPSHSTTSSTPAPQPAGTTPPASSAASGSDATAPQSVAPTGSTAATDAIKHHASAHRRAPRSATTTAVARAHPISRASLALPHRDSSAGSGGSTALWIIVAVAVLLAIGVTAGGLRRTRARGLRRVAR